MRPGGTRPGGTRPPQRPVGLVLNPQKTQKPA
jgi:hypothetical protein